MVCHRRIIFVDDEPQVLEGLQNLLCEQQKTWDMVFVSSGHAALGEFEKGPFDLIVSDLNMPKMDGAQLLHRVKESYPATARVVLSGPSERDSAVRALPVAHQFLTKPCNADELISVVGRTCELQALLSNEKIRGVFGKLDKIPSMPTTYWELTRKIAEPNASISDIAKIVERDIAMSTRILQLANSPYFARTQQTTSITAAVTYLGVEMLKALALVIHVFSSLETDLLALDELQECSFRTAKLARQFLSDKKRADEAFTASLLHDIGKIILAVGMPENFKKVRDEVRRTSRPFHLIEKELLGVTHAEIGAYVLGMWGIPFPIVEAVAYHHNLSAMSYGPYDVLAALHVADVFIDSISRSASADKLNVEFLIRAGLSQEMLRWQAIAEAHLVSF